MVLHFQLFWVASIYYDGYPYGVGRPYFLLSTTCKSLFLGGLKDIWGSGSRTNRTFSDFHARIWGTLKPSKPGDSTDVNPFPKFLQNGGPKSFPNQIEVIWVVFDKRKPSIPLSYPNDNSFVWIWVTPANHCLSIFRDKHCHSGGIPQYTPFSD